MNKSLQEALLARLAELGDPTTTIILIPSIPPPSPLPAIDLVSVFEAKAPELQPQKPTPVLPIVKRLHEEQEALRRQQRTGWRKDGKGTKNIHKTGGRSVKRPSHRSIGGA